MNSSRLYQKTCRIADRVNATRVNLKESLIINGFWRSGTTWVMESAASLINAKVVFEPFNPPNPHFTQVSESPIGQCLSELNVPRSDHAFVCTLMPYVEPPLNPKSQVGQVIQQSLHGIHPYRSSLNNQGWCTKNLQECLRPRVVTKFTRGSLCLRAVQEQFGVPILHVIRDPRSAIASLKKTKNGKLGWGAFNHFPLKAQLLGVQDGRQDYFAQWQDDIERFDRGDDFSRLAAYYCLTERYLLDSFATTQGAFNVVQYESIVQDGLTVLERAIADLGLPLAPEKSIDLARSSVTDWNNQRHAQGPSPQERMFALRKQLTSEETRTIEQVVAHFGMEERLWQEAALSAR